MPLGSRVGACLPAPAKSRPFGAIRLIGPPSSIESFLGAGVHSAPPHLEHFCRLVLAAKPHDEHIQFISTPSLGKLFDPPNQHGLRRKFGLIFEELFVVGISRLGSRWALSPTPIDRLVVLDHEVRVVPVWKINSTGHSLSPFSPRRVTIACSIFGVLRSVCRWLRGRVCRLRVSSVPKQGHVWFRLGTFHSRELPIRPSPNIPLECANSPPRLISRP